MDSELFAELEKHVDLLIENNLVLKRENIRLIEENHRLQDEHRMIATRVGNILKKLEGI